MYHKNGSKTEGGGLHILSWEKFDVTVGKISMSPIDFQLIKCYDTILYLIFFLRNVFCMWIKDADLTFLSIIIQQNQCKWFCVPTSCLDVNLFLLQKILSKSWLIYTGIVSVYQTRCSFTQYTNRYTFIFSNEEKSIWKKKHTLR